MISFTHRTNCLGCTKSNKYLCNQGREFTTTTGNCEMFFCGSDPVIGRMNGVDVMAEYFSGLTPYQYANNQPINFNDPTGAITDDQWWSSPRSMWKDFMDPQQRREQARMWASVQE